MQVLKDLWPIIMRGFVRLRHTLQSNHIRPEDCKVILELRSRDQFYCIQDMLIATVPIDIQRPSDENYLTKRPIVGQFMGIAFEVRVRDASRT